MCDRQCVPTIMGRVLCTWHLKTTSTLAFVPDRVCLELCLLHRGPQKCTWCVFPVRRPGTCTCCCVHSTVCLVLLVCAWCSPRVCARVVCPRCVPGTVHCFGERVLSIVLWHVCLAYVASIFSCFVYLAVLPALCAVSGPGVSVRLLCA